MVFYIAGLMPIFDSKASFSGKKLLKLPIFHGFDFGAFKM